jgi:uncharacterized OsmC-like protein
LNGDRFIPLCTTKEVERMPISGIDARQIETFNKEYEKSPKSFTLGLEARSIWEGRGLGNLGKIGPWKLGTSAMKKPSRDFSVQLGSWQEVGDSLGVEGADDRIEPVEAALMALSSCVAEAITLNCARTGVDLQGLEVKASLDVDPGPIVGAREPEDWTKSMKSVRLDVTANGKFSQRDKTMVEEGAERSPVHHIFGRALDVKTNFKYGA